MDYRASVAALRTERERQIAKQRRDHFYQLECTRADWRARIAKLTAERDQEIRRLRADGMSLAAIAASVGVSHTVVAEVTDPEVREARRRARRRYYERRRERRQKRRPDRVGDRITHGAGPSTRDRRPVFTLGLL